MDTKVIVTLKDGRKIECVPVGYLLCNGVQYEFYAESINEGATIPVFLTKKLNIKAAKENE